VEEAARWAREALEGSLQERERRRAEAVLDGTLEEVLGLPLVLGAVLPRTGASPNLLEYTRWIDEGIEVALERMGGDLRRPVQLEAVDTRGGSVAARASLRSLRSLGALGAIGPVTEEVLVEAMEAREGPFPLISPFASLPPEGDAPGIYSLSGPNPAAARLVARYARDLGLDRVAVLRPGTDEARVDAEIFLREFLDRGGSVPREIVYEPGTTFFEPQFQEVEATLPDGIFLPLSPEDIELLAPQFTFYGMDTLGIQILGTSGWTEEEVVREVETRHTDGVIAATTRPTQDETEARRAFRRAYEEHFQKTLRSDVPAFGHDAAALFLRAFREGPRTSGQLLTALRDIRDFPGATGNLTVEEEWIVREAHLVRLLDRELIYISRRPD
jgi:ABC-type branched-subunit amino acid transport system substrate-binding protein